MSHSITAQRACVLLSLTLLSVSCTNPVGAAIPNSTRIPAASATPNPSPKPSAIPTRTPRVNQTSTGRVMADESWRGEVLITGDIRIPPGVKLTIEPGTVVRFTAQRDDDPHSPDDLIDTAEYSIFPDDPPRIAANMISISVAGELEAVGTPERPILFTSDSPKPARNDWDSIIVTKNGRLTLVNAVVEYNYTGVDFVSVQHPKVELHDNLFRHIAGCCVCTGGGSRIADQIVIERNTFTDCNHEGVDTYKNQDLVIRNNLFVDNVVGVVATNGSTVRIESNVFQRSRWWAIGIYNNSSPIIHGNNFEYNAANLSINNSRLRLDATNNYWGSTNPHTGGQGLADFKPFAVEPFPIPTPIPLMPAG